MRIVLTGGGTGGSVTPLLAIYQQMSQEKKHQFLFIGGRYLVEKDLAEENKIEFQSIASGKLKRYFDFQNFLTPIFIFIGFFQSLMKLSRFRPDVVVAAGSFIAVPVVWAAWCVRIPAVIHQLDLKKSLANILMTPFAKRVTVSFPPSLKDFPRRKTVLTGNPIRKEIQTGERNEAQRMFNLQSNLPTVLILGGGTGALAINKIVNLSLDQLLSFCQIIHIAGKGKNIFQNTRLTEVHRPREISAMFDQKNRGKSPERLERYHVYEFLSDELKFAFQAADVVVTRAGISTLTELALLKKPLIIIPIPDSHQEKNAQYFEKEGAALILNQKLLTTEIFTNFIHDLVKNKKKREELSVNMGKMVYSDAADKIIIEIESLVKNGSK